MKCILLAALFAAAAIPAGAQGLQFSEGDWKGILAKAAEQKKLVYVDVYTTWCGPCKMLAALIFPKKEAGDKYNALFVNYRIDAEKGEGLEIAEKYKVNSYPTHLFINPANGALVYRGSGFSPEVSDFLHEADVAMLEYKDPMSWEKYEKQYAAGKRDKAFLKAYMQKAKRLHHNNDHIINAYFGGLKPKYNPADIALLEENLMTIDNKAFPVLAARWDNQHPDSRQGRYQFAESLLEPTFSKAVAGKDEKLLQAVGEAARKYSSDGERLQYYFATEFYTQTDNVEKARVAAAEEANFYLSKAPEQYRREDEAALAQLRGKGGLTVDMQDNAEGRAGQQAAAAAAGKSSMGPVSAQAAGRLNSIAWGVYEGATDNPAQVTEALEWSRRSMELAGSEDGNAPTEEWPLFADTYAHLLYVSGNREEAVRIQEAAVKAAGSGTETAESLGAELAKMKEGSL